MSGIQLSQFYGIEIDDFAHEVAILSLWLAEHQMNKVFAKNLGHSEPMLPLKTSGKIVSGNSLRIDWLSFLDGGALNSANCEIYICGNPPYKGFNKQNENQKSDIDYVFKGEITYGKLDYIACWFFLGKHCIEKYKSHAECAFVSTSSTCEGEQPAILFPKLLSKEIEIGFAHNSFFWKNSARDNASTRCVIFSLRKKSDRKKLLFRDQVVKIVSNINPYLLDGEDIIISGISKPISPRHQMTLGSNSIDGMHLLVSEEEFRAEIASSPEIGKFFKKFAGGSDLLHGKNRYCIWVDEESYSEACQFEFLKNRFKKCMLYRKGAGRDAQKTADKPYRFCYITHQEKKYIALPQTMTGNREYIPVLICDPSIVVSAKAFAIYELDMFIFGLLSSRIHYDWMDITSGKPAGGGFAYSVRQTYNTFPLPETDEHGRLFITKLAEEILLIREDYPDKTLADLYDPDKMPKPLKEAHAALDVAVDALYRKKPFKDSTERLEHLFALYQDLITKEAQEKAAKRR